MISSPSSIKRRLIPRWRSLTRTIESRELSDPGRKHAPNETGQLPAELLARAQRWRTDPSVITAAELVESAIVHAREYEGIDAARFLARKESCATFLVRKHAGLVLKRTGHEQDVPNDVPVRHKDTVGVWRARSRLHPRDALAWVELALAQVSFGRIEHACRSMAVALQLAPDNRHVLRSAARFFVHAHDPERAHDLIRRSAATPFDPWLIAAEIALASSAERKSKFLKKGISVLEDGGRLPRQISELAGALGTTFLVDGNRKRGKRLFKQSLADPTGNSLAQAEWATRTYGEILVNETQLQWSSDANEAMARYLHRTGQFEQSLDFVSKWIEEEPFSMHPYWAGATAANYLEDYEQAEQLARAGLQHDRRSVALVHSLVFSLACLDRLGEAEQLLGTVSITEGNGVEALVGEADRGLIAFRRGDLVNAEAHYQTAIQGFRQQQMTEMEHLARAYFAREAARAGSESAHRLLAEVESISGKPVRPEVERVTRNARAILDAARSNVQSPSPNGSCPANLERRTVDLQV
jgi:tetratricopeptide (TPR) repeat protein